MFQQILNTAKAFIDNFGSIISFLNEPISYLGDVSPMVLFGASIGTLLSFTFAIHLIRLFVG